MAHTVSARNCREFPVCCLCSHEIQRLNNIPQRRQTKHLQNSLHSVSYKFQSNRQIYRPRMSHIFTFGNVYSFVLGMLAPFFSPFNVVPFHFRSTKMWNEFVVLRWTHFHMYTLAVVVVVVFVISGCTCLYLQLHHG